MDLTQQTIGKLRQMLDRKEVSAPELTKAYLDRIAAYDKTIQSYITVTAERAMADADAAQKKIDAGNAGMASGGMGDVLSGIIGALLGQKMSPYDAACAGCVAHGAAADVLAARFGTRGMLATDLFSTLQRIVNPEVTDKNHDESSNSAP